MRRMCSVSGFVSELTLELLNLVVVHTVVGFQISSIHCSELCICAMHFNALNALEVRKMSAVFNPSHRPMVCFHCAY